MSRNLHAVIPRRSDRSVTPPRQYHPFKRSVLSLLLGLSGVWGVLLGCSGDTTGPVPLSATQLYWALQFNQHAVSLALTALAGQPVYDTVQLSAIARNAVGAPLAGAGAVTYRTVDSTLTVDSLGLVTAHYLTSQTQVIASLTMQGTTHTDTAFIQVTLTPPAAPLTFSIQPGPGDSAKTALFEQAQISVSETDAAHQTVCGHIVASGTTDTVFDCPMPVYFVSSDPAVADVDHSSGAIASSYWGRVTFTASTLAWGVVKRDSLRYTIGYPLTMQVDAKWKTPIGSIMPVLSSFVLSLDTVGVGAQVTFYNPEADSIDVRFDDTTSVIGGNIYPLASDGLGDCCSIVTFLKAGTYSFRSHKKGVGGTIVVSSGP